MSLGELPDDVLVAVLGHLSLHERHATATRVCSRWRRLVNLPALVAGAEFVVDATSARGAATLQSFCAWLCRHGRGRVRRLVLELAGPSRAAALALAAAGPSLQQLTLTCQQRVDSCAWMRLEAMAGLRRLQLGGNDGESCCVDADLAALSRLERLSIMNLEDDLASLPPSLTSLHIEGYRGNALPRQVSTLARLQRLVIWDAQLDSGSRGFAPLDSLSACLTQLMVRRCAHVPPGLSRLTSLQRLCLLPEEAEPGEWAWGGAPGQHVQAALLRLRRLRHLALAPMPGCMEPPPALAAGPAQLASFAWVTPGPLSSRSTAALPGGEWLAGLRRLAAPASMLARSLPALAAARSLCFLGVDAGPPGSSPVPPELLAWAAGLPMLRHCVLGSADAAEGARAVAALRAARPLLIDCGAAAFHFPASMPPGVLGALPPALPAAAPAAGPSPQLPLAFKRYCPPFQYQRFLLCACGFDLDEPL